MVSEEAEQQAGANDDVPPPRLQIVISIPFVSFFFLSIHILFLLPFSILPLLPFPLSPSFPTIPSSLLFNSLSKDFKFHSVSLLSKASLACGSSALPSPLICLVFLGKTVFILAPYAMF